MSRYSQLFGIEVRHSFFSNGLCHELNFTPTPKTAVKLSNSGLLFKETSGGVRVFYDSDRLDSLRLHAADAQEPLNLVFKAYSRDAFFMNYTECGPDQDDAVRYFDSANAVTQHDGRMRLHAKEYSGSDDFKPMDFAGFQDVLTPADRLLRPTLVVKIGVPKEVADALGDDATGAVGNYFVSFQGRQTVWKYFLLGELAREDIYIADLDNSTEFESSVAEVLADERTAITIKSKTMLRLQERSDYRFQLREEDSGNGKVLIRRLPVATAAHIGAERTGDQSTLVSEMYINT
ncbi:MAG: hypothetical protein IH872_06120 [Chloroflexi bacterium]|nr:hypothetical protein [Chloroflexota bacterium]